mgnify:CR=1 FL=1
MMLILIFYYLLMALILFFLINFLKFKKKDSLLFPIFYLFICASYLELHNLAYNYIFIIIVFEFFIELFYNYTLRDNKASFDINYFLKKYSFLIIFSVFLENYLFSKVSSILPNIEMVKTIIWFIILLYLYNLVEELIKVCENGKNTYNALQDKNYIISSYAKYKLQYKDILSNYEIPVKELALALLIYEDYNTPKLKRNLDNFLFGRLKKVGKLGIMQVETKTFITDEESIRFVCNALEKKYEEISYHKNNTGKIILKDYLKDYNKYNIVVNIYENIKAFEELN